ncbi:MAG: hypothetical protein EOO13_15845 [Chitinophagaceae bacterium]|nr:MAG: hypothetical protein EOO13_15845 [Chitinophagaceae bacterium]
MSFTERGLGALSKKFADVFCLANNPAASMGAEGFSAGIYSERRFMLEELGQYNMVLAYAKSNSIIGAKLNYNGFSEYNESSASLVYGHDLGKLSVGIGFNYHKVTFQAYGAASTYSADLSLIMQLTEKLRAGIQAINPVPVFFGPEKTEKYPAIYKLGLGYEVSEKCFLAGELLKETGKTVNVQVGLQYRLVNSIIFRVGINTDVGRPFAGIDWIFNKLRLCISGSYHPDLGFTPALMIAFMKQ